MGLGSGSEMSDGNKLTGRKRQGKGREHSRMWPGTGLGCRRIKKGSLSATSIS
jgi:hypothetical protein